MCKALAGDKLAYWQLGNEPDLFKTSSQGPVRPSWWNETYYVQEYLNKTRIMRDIVSRDCPDVIQNGRFKFYSPSFAGTSNSLNMIRTWQSSLDADQEVALVDSHNYIGGATQPGVTLQGTLMNRTSTVLSVNKHLNESTLLKPYTDLPYVLGETNSLCNEGAPGLSNSFGAALWGVDFNLYCAATGIQRVHMHQGTNYRYQSWQPVETVNETMGTKAPYYGNIAVASFLGDLTKGNVSISDIELGSIYEDAYAAYVDDRLERIAIVQMNAYNYTNSTGPRPSKTYSFQLPHDCGMKQVGVQRLMANGSDAITGVTFDGYSYNYELDNGKPVLQKNVTRGETLEVGKDGLLEVEVPWSSAAILSMGW